jgi:phospholipase A1
VKKLIWLLIGLVFTLHTQQLFAQTGDVVEDESEAQYEQVINACLSSAIISASPDKTVEQLRKACEKKSSGKVQERLFFEKSVGNNPFAILPHRPNYLLPISYAELDQTIYEPQLQGNDLDNVETKFQVSLKYVAAEDFVFDGVDLQFAFTATSWWQSYNDEISAPFRETNYEPELIFAYTKPWSLFGLPVKHGFISLNHQSNGQSGLLSRSWNRIIGGLSVEHNQVVWHAQLWWRFPEDAKTDPSDPGGDDNPDILDFMGDGQLGALWRLPRNHNLELRLRNNLSSDNKGAIEIGWSFPLTSHLRGFVQYFNGYGESLVYYNESVQRFSIGIKLTDWL